MTNPLKDKLPFEGNTSLVNGEGYGGKWLPSKTTPNGTSDAIRAAADWSTFSTAPNGAETCCVPEGVCKYQPITVTETYVNAKDWLNAPQKSAEVFNTEKSSGTIKQPITFLTEPASSEEYAAQCGLAEQAKKYDQLVSVVKRMLKVHLQGYTIGVDLVELFEIIYGGE